MQVDTGTEDPSIGQSAKQSTRRSEPQEQAEDGSPDIRNRLRDAPRKGSPSVLNERGESSASCRQNDARAVSDATVSGEDSEVTFLRRMNRGRDRTTRSVALSQHCGRTGAKSTAESALGRVSDSDGEGDDWMGDSGGCGDEGKEGFERESHISRTSGTSGPVLAARAADQVAGTTERPAVSHQGIGALAKARDECEGRRGGDTDSAGRSCGLSRKKKFSKKADVSGEVGIHISALPFHSILSHPLNSICPFSMARRRFDL